MTLQLPETGGIWGDRGTELALHRADPFETCDPNLARPATAGVGAPERACPVPAVTLRHRPRLQVAARQYRLDRLVERVERNELACLERGAIIEVFQKRFRIRTLVIGAAHCGLSVSAASHHIGSAEFALPRTSLRFRSRVPTRGWGIPSRRASRSGAARGANRQSADVPRPVYDARPRSTPARLAIPHLRRAGPSRRTRPRSSHVHRRMGWTTGAGARLRYRQPARLWR